MHATLGHVKRSQPVWMNTQRCCQSFYIFLKLLIQSSLLYSCIRAFFCLVSMGKRSVFVPLRLSSCALFIHKASHQPKFVP